MTTSSKPLISVVTPMYNEAAHIAECIESVLSQTYRNWEYIVVDNCSTDDSLEIVRRYAAKDNRIRIVRNPALLPAIPNHNAALREISSASKYCKVIFADDWIFPNCLEEMLKVAETHPSAGLVGAYGLEGAQVVWTGLSYPSSLVTGKEICRRLFLDGLYVFGTATSLLYRSDLVRARDPFYDPADIHTDMEVCVILLKCCDFAFVHQVLTYTRARGNSRITLSRNVNTLDASKLRQLVKHGRDYLTEEEYERCLHQSVSKYYWYLAGCVVRGRNKAFWDFHKRTFEQSGLRVSRTRLARTVVARLCSAGLTLHDSLRSLRNRAPDQSKLLTQTLR